jgi:hypothetical protein
MPCVTRCDPDVIPQESWSRPVVKSFALQVIDEAIQKVIISTVQTPVQGR